MFNQIFPPFKSYQKAPKTLQNILNPAHIQLNGKSAWDIQVLDKRFYREILTKGTLGVGEAYMKNYWDSKKLDETFTRLFRLDINETVTKLTKLKFFFEVMRHVLFNLQSQERAFEVAIKHYDLDNHLFQKMLDSTMNYSCGYWKKAKTLEEAQQHKLELICRKLELKVGEHLLDIGCGWGGLAFYAAKHYGVKVTGITISKAQQTYAKSVCKGLPINIHLLDYRVMEGKFDKIVSVGMFEHVGHKNYKIYFKKVASLLKDDGLFLLHSIGNYVTSYKTDAWIEKYIFPNGKLPSANQISLAIEKHFIIEDWHNFGPDYDKTLMAWWYNFNQAWPLLKHKYDDVFYRMWKYYLHSCAGFFRSKQGQLWQIVMSKRNRLGPYHSVR